MVVYLCENTVSDEDHWKELLIFKDRCKDEEIELLSKGIACELVSFTGPVLHIKGKSNNLQEVCVLWMDYWLRFGEG